MTSIAERWQKARKDLKLTQAQLAEKLEVSAPYLSLIESGKRRCPSVDIVKRMHQLSGVKYEYLIGNP